jgi:hypothetical protein
MKWYGVWRKESDFEPFAIFNDYFIALDYAERELMMLPMEVEFHDGEFVVI